MPNHSGEGVIDKSLRSCVGLQHMVLVSLWLHGSFAPHQGLAVRIKDWLLGQHP
jgi:hypothetical protein